MKKVLLLNPPGDQQYIRDYFCSKVSKSGYLYHPTDLLVLSGFLAQQFDVLMIDAIVEQYSTQSCLEKIQQYAPDHVVFITGSVSFSKDMEFLGQVKKHVPSVQKIVGTGDIFFEKQEEKLQRYPFLDAVFFDFTTDNVTKYLAEEPCEHVLYKDGDTFAGSFTSAKVREFSMPVPCYELFPSNKYNYPFVRQKPFAVVITNYGCPFKCTFCIMPKLGFKYRNVENTLEELQYLKDNGFKNIYFNDQTFGAHKKQTYALLEAMVERKLNMGFVCFTRTDVLNEKMVRLMKKAGCHTVMFGIETADTELLQDYHKGTTLDMVRSATALCKQYKIRTLGTFILGLPGETHESAVRTIDFAKSIPLDYAAFNIAIPRMGTDLREKAVSEQLVGDDLEEMDQSGSQAVIETKTLSLDEVEALQKKAYREFYFRPTKLLAKVLDIRSTEDLKNHVRNGWGVFMGLFK